MHSRCNKYNERKTDELVSLHCSYFFMLLMCYVALFLNGQFVLQQLNAVLSPKGYLHGPTFLGKKGGGGETIPNTTLSPLE